MDFMHHYGDDDEDEDEDSNSNVDRLSATTKMMNDGRVTRKRRKPSKERTVVIHSHHANDSRNNIGNVKRRVTLESRIPIVTETEYSRINERRKDSVQPQPGRWSTHCSCTISLNRDEIKRAHQYVRWLCRTIQQYCPTYVGHAIVLFHDHQPLPTTTNATTMHQSSSQLLLQHVSLTRPDVALHHTQQIESFVQSLTIELQQQQQPPFYLTLLGPTTPNQQGDNDHHPNHVTAKMLQQHILHDTTKTKSFGIWRCHGPTAVSSLQRLSDACNRVLGQHYQQGTYHYQREKNDTEMDPNHRQGDPIYHVSLVRFEPCLHDYLTMMSQHAEETTTTTTTTPVDHPDDDDDDDADDDADDETSRVNGEWSDDSDDDECTNHYHYVDHVTCQFGGGAKVYQIPFSTT